MILNQQQIHDILSIIDRQVAFVVGSTLGQQFLSQQNKDTLKSAGIDIDSLYKQSNDPVLLNFHLGMLSDIIGSNAVQSLTFDQLKKYVISGQHIPLSQRERLSIDSIKNQSLADIRSQQGKIFQDINNVVNNESQNIRAHQEQFIKEQILEGIARRDSVKKISTQLARLTGDWTRNFSKSVQYISHTALNEGRLAMIQRRYDDSHAAQVYFHVQGSACDHCVKAYLKDKQTREPKIFTVQELLRNGSNIGRKANEWLPTVQPLHPNCRCLLTEYHDGDQWNGHKFITPHQATYHPTIKRNKVRIVFNGTEYFV